VPTHLGAERPSKVKITSGGGLFGEVAFPKSTTVSPDKTLLTLAMPVLGRTTGGLAVTGAADMTSIVRLRLLVVVGCFVGRYWSLQTADQFVVLGASWKRNRLYSYY